MFNCGGALTTGSLNRKRISVRCTMWRMITCKIDINKTKCNRIFDRIIDTVYLYYDNNRFCTVTCNSLNRQYCSSPENKSHSM